MSRLRLFGYYLPSLLSVVGRFYRLVARSDKRIVRFARVVARCGVVVNEDSSVNFNRGTAGFPVGILNVDDRIPTVDGIALRFEYTAINLQVSFLRGACRCYQNTRVGNSGSIRTDGEVSVLDRRSALRNTDRCIGPFAAAAAVNGNGAVDNQIGATAIDACNVCGCTVFGPTMKPFPLITIFLHDLLTWMHCCNSEPSCAVNTAPSFRDKVAEATEEI